MEENDEDQVLFLAFLVLFLTYGQTTANRIPWCFVSCHFAWGWAWGIYLEKNDEDRFINVLAQACECFNWVVHAYLPDGQLLSPSCWNTWCNAIQRNAPTQWCLHSGI